MLLRIVPTKNLTTAATFCGAGVVSRIEGRRLFLSLWSLVVYLPGCGTTIIIAALTLAHFDSHRWPSAFCREIIERVVRRKIVPVLVPGKERTSLGPKRLSNSAAAKSIQQARKNFIGPVCLSLGMCFDMCRRD